jgi:hypothetical protein
MKEVVNENNDVLSPECSCSETIVIVIFHLNYIECHTN